MNEIITYAEREVLFEILSHEATHCHDCPRMADRTAVLSRRNGSLTPKALFIGEAPGRHGADRTRRPFHGDVSGTQFDQLLTSADLPRSEIFITNAVLCCPADAMRNNTPLSGEIRQCGHYLRDLITLLQPPVVVTLGAVALRALGRIIRRPLVLAETVGTIIECEDFLLVPLYHPSPRVLHTLRSLDEQLADFAAVREAVAWTTGALV